MTHLIPLTIEFKPRRLPAYRVPEKLKPEVDRQIEEMLRNCRAVLVDGPSFPLLCVARTDLGMNMDAILVTIQGLSLIHI